MTRSERMHALVRCGHTIAQRGPTWQWRSGRCSAQEHLVLEFPSLERARCWYDSEDSRGPKALRMRSAKTDVVFVEGVA